MRVRFRFPKRIPKRFPLNNLIFTVALLCISSYGLLEHMSITVPLFTFVKWPLIYAGGACVLTQIGLLVKNFMRKRYFYGWLTVLLFCLSLVISAFANRNPEIGVSPVRSTLRTSLYVLELYALTVWAAEKGKGKYTISFLFRYVLILVLITDFLLLTGLVRFGEGRHEGYLLGTKFTVAYMHMNLLTLGILHRRLCDHQRRIPKLMLLLAAVILVLISLRVQCMTGLLGCVLLLICMWLIERPYGKRLQILNSPYTLLMAFMVCLIFPFLSELIVSIPAVNYFVVEVLERSTNLTGRVEIFHIFGSQMQGHGLFGFGLGNGFAAAKELFGYANAQNALLQWILQTGIVTTAVLVAAVMLTFVHRNQSGRIRQSMPLVILIYVYILLGAVETTFSMSFFLFVALLVTVLNDQEKVTM